MNDGIYFRAHSNDRLKKGEMLNIRAFAKICHTTVHTLRYYDEAGIFKPKEVNKAGYRYYTEEQVKDFEEIKDLRDIGFSIEELRNLSKEHLPELLDTKIGIYETKIQKAIQMKKQYGENKQ